MFVHACSDTNCIGRPVGDMTDSSGTVEIEDTVALLGTHGDIAVTKDSDIIRCIKCCTSRQIQGRFPLWQDQIG